jgi:hypothetical protein
MSEIGPSGSQASADAVAADVHALAQVEKWMAVIREVTAKPRDDRAAADE